MHLPPVLVLKNRGGGLVVFLPVPGELPRLLGEFAGDALPTAFASALVCVITILVDHLRLGEAATRNVFLVRVFLVAPMTEKLALPAVDRLVAETAQTNIARAVGLVGKVGVLQD